MSYEETYTPESVAEAVKQYDGVKRKQAIGRLVKALEIENPDVVAAYGEDAAVIRQGHTALLLAADGIWNQLMDVDPYWAGYCAILVNVHDIAAMGGRPVAMVDVLSASSDALMAQVSAGMHDAAVAFDVPIVGGHLHPDAPYNVIDVSILGVADIDNIIYSSRAAPGNVILCAMDLNGRVHPSAKMNWDCVTMKTPEVLRKQIAVMKELAEHHLVTAGKDISNPGILGTLGMLLEASNAGAEVDLTAIPRPDLDAVNVPFEQWVRMYPGMAFILTVEPDAVEKVCRAFRKTGMACQQIGRVNDSHSLVIAKGDAKTTLFNFHSSGITNI
ncbi:MAG TPA: methanogenesis marker 2 protein [Methanocorpusculum sp.]|nr:methanogenesis marker 2 protein [Methanocorpusculum sp.]